MRSLIRLLTVTLATLPLVTHAAPLRNAEVKQAVSDYAKARGFRTDRIQTERLGLSESGKSTLATVTVGGKHFKVAINNATGRLQSQETATLIEGLLAAHVPQKRAGMGARSSFATKLVSLQPGRGVERATLRGKAAPLGRPRAGQSRAQLALDALPLGLGGSATVELAQGIVAGKRGAAVRVRENGLGSGPDIINQTPGLVSVSDGTTWYRLGYAGYQTAGDRLVLANAIDKIPAGTVITRVRVTDDPTAPHPHGLDATDNAVATARGVRGFDLVSVEGLAGSGK
jgi:hypothetical protein